MRQYRFLYFIVAAFLSGRLFSQPAAEISVVLHEKIGSVIDAAENQRYNFFGEIPGLTAVCLNKVSFTQHRFCLLRTTGDGAQLLVIDRGSRPLAEILAKIAERVKGVDEQNRAAVAPILVFKDLRWDKLSPMQKLQLRDGSLLYGIPSRAVQDTLIFSTLAGLTIPVPLGMITDAGNESRELTNSGFYRDDPNGTRLFFAPTGRSLPAGRGYFADYYVFFPTVAYGLTDFFALAGGMSIFPGGEEQLFYLMPKMTFRLTKKLGVGGGLMAMVLPGEIDNQTLGYVITSYGSEKSAVTLGAGLPFGDSNAASIFVIGGELQVSNSAKLITENWIFNGEDNFTAFSGGMRFFGERIAVDLALFTAAEAFEGEGFPFMPWVDFSVVFGK